MENKSYINKKYNTYLDWILLVNQYNLNSDLMVFNKVDFKEILETKNNNIQEITSKDIIKMLDEKEVTKKEIDEIASTIEYSYKYKLATTIPTKSSVTEIKKMNQKQLENSTENDFKIEKEITFEKPKFLQEDAEEKITSAQKGTLIHLCMQRLKPKEDYDIDKIRKFIEDMALKEIITNKEKEAINPYKILEFTKSKIWYQLKNAKEYYQEKPFYITVPAEVIYNEKIDENILVQGVIDLYFIDKDNNIILVDYKTDYVENGNEIELVTKYKSQLDLYKQALESALNKKVYKTYIYSVYLGKEIEIS